MITNAERKGNMLVLTIKLADKPIQSKSAIAKAQAKWDEAHPAKKVKQPDGTEILVPGTPFDPSTVAGSLLASTGGFQTLDGCRVSLNVITPG